MFFHDERMYPEPAGFWMPGQRTAQITVAVPPGHTAPVVLRIHSGGKANLATFTTFDWERDYSLVPGQADDVELPMVNGSVIPLTVSVRDRILSDARSIRAPTTRGSSGSGWKSSASAKATADKTADKAR